MNIRIRPSLIVKRDAKRFLFVRHCKNEKKYWLFPGGGQDTFESMIDGAKRELREETGIVATQFRFVALRESMNEKAGKHTQFPVFEVLDPDFSNLSVGVDHRLEGIDFFTIDEILKRPFFPDFGEDLEKMLTGKPVEQFKTLPWKE
ncbi:MAG: NUDIX hydrolase [Candidatus Riflebacteria bacterium]|nr:NUDIX hydrolase [Candidatus Riflebacteria bacterium]